MKYDSLLGTDIVTVKGNTLTIIRRLDGTRSRCIKYEVVCDVCSKDTEMFPDAFKISKYNLRDGNIPCGCGTKSLTKRQLHLKITRFCEKNNYIFRGFQDDNEAVRGVKQRVIIECPIHSGSISNVTVEGLFNSKNGGCRLCGVEDSIRANLKEDSEIIQTFYLRVNLWRVQNSRGVRIKQEGHFGICTVLFAQKMSM